MLSSTAHHFSPLLSVISDLSPLPSLTPNWVTVQRQKPRLSWPIYCRSVGGQQILAYTQDLFVPFNLEWLFLLLRVDWECRFHFLSLQSVWKTHQGNIFSKRIFLCQIYHNYSSWKVLLETQKRWDELHEERQHRSNLFPHSRDVGDICDALDWRAQDGTRDLHL